MAKVAKWCGNSVRVIEERYSHLSHDFLHEVSDQVVGAGRAQVQVPPARSGKAIDAPQGFLWSGIPGSNRRHAAWKELDIVALSNDFNVLR